MNIIRKTIENDEKFLRQISKEVSFNDKSYLKDIEKLKEFCSKIECFALAAVQIGIPKRIVYLNSTSLEDEKKENTNYDESKVLINPIIISRKGKTKYWEACLSCLDNMGLVIRPYEIVVKYHDIDKNEHIETFKGFESTIISHEIDHLDGVLHIDIAEEVIEMTREERKKFRETHPYEIISKTCNYERK